MAVVTHSPETGALANSISVTKRYSYGEARREAASLGIAWEVAVAFHDQRRMAKKRGIAFLITLPEWWAWWQVDGRWERRGRGADRLLMARQGDVGPYSLNNIYCTTGRGNHADVPLRVWIAASEKAAMARGPGNYAMPWKGVRGDGHPAARPVITPLGRFGSAALAAEAHGISSASASDKARTGWKGWSYEAKS